MLIWAAEAMTLAMLIAFIWAQARSQLHFLHWCIGFVLHGLGIAFVGLRGTIPDFVSIEIGNVIALSSFWFWIAGLRHFDGRQPAGWALTPLLVFIAGMLIPVVREDFASRVLLYNGASVMGFLMMAFTAKNARFSSRKYRTLLFATWIVQSASCMTLALGGPLSHADGFADIPLHELVGLVNVLCFVCAVLIGAKMLMDQSEKRLLEMVRSDPLTGALNRRGLLESFTTLKSEAGARSSSQLALILFDLDHFKQVNDNHGHQAGDRVLVAFANVCSSVMQSTATFARTGGEEFAALIQVDDLRRAAAVAEAVRRRLMETAIAAPRGEIRVTVSIGIAAAPMVEADIDRLMSTADRALYRAKADGRNRTMVVQDGQLMVVPQAERAGASDLVDENADKQVAVLRRLTLIGGSDLDRAKG